MPRICFFLRTCLLQCFLYNLFWACILFGLVFRILNRVLFLCSLVWISGTVSCILDSFPSLYIWTFYWIPFLAFLIFAIFLAFWFGPVFCIFIWVCFLFAFQTCCCFCRFEPAGSHFRHFLFGPDSCIFILPCFLHSYYLCMFLAFWTFFYLCSELFLAFW